MTDHPDFGKYLSRREALEYEKAIDPNVYAVLHLHRWLDAVQGCPKIYENEALAFLTRLSVRVHGKKGFKRRKPGNRLLANMATLESPWDVPHLNIMVHRPDWQTFHAFEEVFREEWMRSAWAGQWDGAYYCREREPGSSLIGYAAKQGRDTIFMSTLTFLKRSGF